MIHHSKPWIGREEERHVLDVLRSGYLSGGPKRAAFERSFAELVGRRYALGTSTGTAALHLALVVLGVGRGDGVIVPSYVCSAVLNAVRHVGARPVLVDVEPRTYTIDPLAAKRAVTKSTRAVIAAHMFGAPADIAALRRALPGVPVIEDGTQAIGAYRGRGPVGRLGDVAVFSFYATKLLCTASGGMLVGRKADVERARGLADYDNRDQDVERYSYAMSDVAAALGLGQLARYTEVVRRRRELARLYIDTLAGALPASCLPPSPAAEGTTTPQHVYYRFVISAREGSDRLCAALYNHGVEAKRPVHAPLHRLMQLDAKRYPVSERAHQTVVSLPLYPTLSDREARRVARAAREVLL